MDQLSFDFVKICTQHLNIGEDIVEFGSFIVPAQEQWNLRPIFSRKNFIGCDYRNGNGVDIWCDIHDIPCEPNFFDTVICLNTLEHVAHPEIAVKELKRILKPTGYLLISVPFHFHIHDYPGDFWRFTPQCVEEILLENFSNKLIIPIPNTIRPRTIIAIGSQNEIPEILKTNLNKLYYKEIPDFKGFIRLILPPIILQTYLKLKYL